MTVVVAQSTYSVPKFLGLKSIPSQLDLIQEVNRGLRLNALSNLTQVMGKDMTDVLSRSTIGRVKSKKTHRFSKEASEAIYNLAKVYSAAADMYGGNFDKARRFVDTPHQLLKGKTPFEVTKESNVGADVVMALISQIRSGVSV